MEPRGDCARSWLPRNRGTHAVECSAVIEADAFAERSCRMPFAASNDASVFGVVVTRAYLAAKFGLHPRRFDGMRDFVLQAERRRLPSAARRAQRAVRIPSDRVGIRIEVIVIAVIDRQSEGSRG